MAAPTKPRPKRTRGSRSSTATPSEPGCQNCAWRPAPGAAWPTHGAVAVRWIEDNCICGEGDFFGKLIKLRLDQKRFLYRWYEYCPQCGQWHYDEALRGAATGDGKALALDTPIPTPSGWTTMGELRAGDAVFDERGDVCRVVYKSPVFADHDCFAVEFSDGERIVADAEHRWQVDERGSHGFTGEPVVRTTQELFDRGVRYRNNVKRYRLPMPAPLNLPDAELLVDPYLLGAWLGDGDTADAAFTMHADDLPNFRTQVELAGYHVLSVAPDRRRPTTLSVRVTTQARKGTRQTVPSLKGRLRDLGVLGNKHVPQAYLRASEKQRLALLQGLMDTDGSVSSRGQCEFTSTNKGLADAVVELLASLGVKSGCSEGVATLNGRRTGAKWRVHFEPTDVPVFRLDRKTARLRTQGSTRPLSLSRQITAIRPVESVPTQCIQVDSPSHLYLAGRKMVQTHNTQFIASIVVLEFAGPPQIAISSPNIPIAAASFEQADLLFTAVATMCGGRDQAVKESPLCGFFEVYDTEIKFSDGRPGRIFRVAAVAGTNEGGLPSLFVCDELHEWGEPTRPGEKGSRKARVKTVIGKSTKKRRTPRGSGRQISLSTAGFDIDNSLLGDMVKLGRRVLKNPAVSPRFLMDWREAPDGLDYRRPDHRERAVIAASAAANVLWSVQDRVNAWGKPDMPAHEWIRYYANRWVDVAEDSWLKDHPAAWSECKGSWKSSDENEWLFAVDMALKHDSVAVDRIEKLPDGRVAVTAKIWRAEDHSGRIPHDDVWNYIKDNAKGLGFRGVVYDPRYFEVPARMLEDHNILAIEFDQSPVRVAPACGLTFKLILEQTIVQDGDPDFAAHVKTAVSVPQERGGFTLKKGRSRGHIDACVAMCMGVWVLFEVPFEEEVPAPFALWGDR